MTLEQINDRILKLKEEQILLSNNYDQMQTRLNQMRVRYSQISGAVAELEDIKKSLNGSEQT